MLHHQVNSSHIDPPLSSNRKALAQLTSLELLVSPQVLSSYQEMVELTYDYKVKVHSFPANKMRVPGDKKSSLNIIRHTHHMSPSTIV
ncbi:uncharacterized protein LOC135340960 isoform X2 [Halichondria panicea]|uniref:uncharacterized protein LOC135340960 isoform X2 n=1 Tax=Halichondria panicea TaxID=6063 RepID=UPI00312B8F75